MKTEVLFFDATGACVHSIRREKQNITEKFIKLTARKLGLFNVFYAKIYHDDVLYETRAFKWNPLLTRHDLVKVIKN